MSTHITLTSIRATPPDPVALLAAIKLATKDSSAVLADPGRTGTWTGKKSTPWTESEIAEAQAILDSSPALTKQVAAQRSVDAWPLEYKALVLFLVDALNVVRGKLPTPLPLITPAQALQAIREKASTL